MKVKFSFEFCIFLFLIGTTIATITPVHFPNPMKDTFECGRRGKISNICDPFNYLSYKQANHLDALINKVSE